MLSTPKEDLIKIGKKFKEIRLSQRLMRKTLALRSGMSESSLKRFEVTGEISLDSLIKISNVLNVKNWISTILDEEHFESINDIVKSKKKIKKRGII